MKGKISSIVALSVTLTIIVTLVTLAGTELAMFQPASDTWQVITTPPDGTLYDVMPSPDGMILFLSITVPSIAAPPTNTSTLWRSPVPVTQDSWTDVITETTLSWIIRPSPNYLTDSTLFWCDRGGTEIRRSLDGGDSFTPLVVLPWAGVALITDVTVEDANTLYSAPGFLVYSSTNNGLIWSEVPAGVTTIFMIAMAPAYPNIPVAGHVLVGGTEGLVSYSTDGGANFTPLPPLPVGGNVQVAADTDYATNNTIYAGSSNGNVYRYVIGTSTDWEEINATVANVSGLVVCSGNLYVADATPGGGVYRTYNPTAAAPDWEHLTNGLSGGETFDRVPSAPAGRKSTLSTGFP